MSSPHLSMLPLRKFSTSTSKRASMESSSSRPRGLRTSSVMPCLPRFATFHHSGDPSWMGCMWRSASLPSGSSSFTTSAPWSAHRVAPLGAASTVAMSRMRTPASAPRFEEEEVMETNEEPWKDCVCASPHGTRQAHVLHSET